MDTKADKKLEQNHFEYLLEQQVEYSKQLKQENDQMREILKLIWETDALAQWAWEKGDDDESIADILRETMKKIK